MEQLVIAIPIALIVVLGAYMIVTGSPALLHSYHYATTPPEKLPALARACGAGLVLCGAGIGLLCANGWLAIAGIALLMAGIALTLVAIVHYNGSLISGGGIGGDLRWLSPGARIAVCALIGTAVAAVCAVLGIRMIATGDVSALHGYHYANVAAADLPAFAAAEGASMLAVGFSVPLCMTAGAGLSLRRPSPVWARVAMGAGIALLIIGLAGLLGFIIYFNGTLMA